MSEHLYLAKANNDLVCLCNCAEATIASPMQMDCPWCGCGWLFICSGCRKAFTFARAVEVRESWQDTAEQVIRTMYRREPEQGEAEQWIDFMKILLKGVRLGQEYVYLDGWVIPASAHAVRMEGWHSNHDLPYVPQVAAMDDPTVSERVLSNRNYWTATTMAAE